MARFMALMFASCLVVSPAAWAQQEDSKQKVKAVRDLAKQGSASIPGITQYLQDPDPSVRREAAKSLTAAGTPASLEPLLAATKDSDVEVQIRAIDGIVNVYLPGYIDTSLSANLSRSKDSVSGRFQDPCDAVVDPDTTVRPEIVDTFGRLAAAGAASDVRSNAARALGVLRGGSALSVLADLLRSKDSRLMYESLIAMQKIGDRAIAPRLVFVARDPDEKVRLAAIETIGLLGAKEAVPELRRSLESSPEKKTRKALLEALARIPDPANRQMFLGLLSDKEEFARAAAGEGLGRIGDLQDLQPLESAYSAEKKTSARLAQAFGLAALGQTVLTDFSALRYLVNNLNVRAWRGVAEPYLSELAFRQNVRQALYTVLGTGTPAEKSRICRALASSRSADAVAPIEALAKDPDPAVSLEALRALRLLRGAAR